MEIPSGNWIDEVDYSTLFPDEPLVAVGFPRLSPYQSLLLHDGIHALTPFLGDQVVQGYGNGGAGGLLRKLSEAEAAMLVSGPAEASRLVCGALHVPPVTDGRQVRVSLREWACRDFFGRSEPSWSSRHLVPVPIGLTPLAASLYLAAIGLSDRPVPLSFAHALLDPGFALPLDLSELVSMKAAPEVSLRSLWVDEDHRLVILDGDASAGYGDPDRLQPSQGSKPLHVLSEGWRLRSRPIFLGYSTEPVERNRPRTTVWPYDHDGTRLVRLHSDRWMEQREPKLPIVDLDEIVPDLAMLFDEVQADPARMLDASHRTRKWRQKRTKVSAVARRIVETALTDFLPWPYPFKRRTDSEMRLRPRESADAVVAMFDRLLDAPGPLRPTDLTAYFFSLITKRRAEFAAWPEDCAGVWGFKIKTGDHNWINGRIWHEPGVEDDPDEPVEFGAEDALIERTRFRDKYRHRVNLRSGSLRCYIERDDT